MDLGTKRVGLAIADTAVGIARPLATVARAETIDDDAAVLRRVCDEQRVDEVIVGLPLEASGAEGRMAADARAWADAMAPLVGRPFLLRDERLSSFEAERRVGPMGRGPSGGPPSRARRTAHRSRIDREAAAVILQDEIDARTAPGPAPALVAPEVPALVAPQAPPLAPPPASGGKAPR